MADFKVSALNLSADPCSISPQKESESNAVGLGSDFFVNRHLILKTDGTLWAYEGTSEAATFLSGESKVDTFHILDHVVSIDACNWRCYALQEDGTLWGWRTWFYGDDAGTEPQHVADDVVNAACYGNRVEYV